MRILSVSDTEVGFIYSPMIVERFQTTDLVISCGDLPYYYLEYIVSMLNVPVYFVRGNHASKIEITSGGERTYPWGAVELHQRVIRDKSGLLLAGLEGSLQYNKGPHQYTQDQYWNKAFRLVPGLMINKLRTGRYLDILVTHAPPWKIHDADDLPHRGIKAFRWLIDVFKPAIHLHGHIHVYRQDTVTETLVGETRVVNTYGYREFDFCVPQRRNGKMGKK
jgi:Icc-related predicted phosphoesterase